MPWVWLCEVSRTLVQSVVPTKLFIIARKQYFIPEDISFSGHDVAFLLSRPASTDSIVSKALVGMEVERENGTTALKHNHLQELRQCITLEV